MIATARRSLAALLAAAALASTAACAADASDPGTDPGGVDTAAAAAFDGTHVGVEPWAAAAAESGVVILDVRTPEEFAAGHLDGAILVNLNGADFAGEVAKLDPTLEYAVYCRSGNRSRTAIDIMTQLGFDATVGLEGGIGAWVDSGRPVVTG